MARVAEDVVVLDAREGQYQCLPDLGPVLDPMLDGGLAEPPADLTNALIEADLASRTPPPARLTLETAVGEVPVEGVSSWANALGAAASLATSTVAFRRKPFAALLPPPRLKAATGDLSVRDTVRAASAALPWLPGEGACLQRSYQLRRLLAARGRPTAWVFGVRTWPFAAHCWLQAGDQVIADRLERVRRYTPIMVA